MGYKTNQLPIRPPPLGGRSRAVTTGLERERAASRRDSDTQREKEEEEEGGGSLGDAMADNSLMICEVHKSVTSTNAAGVSLDAANAACSDIFMQLVTSQPRTTGRRAGKHPQCIISSSFYF